MPTQRKLYRAMPGDQLRAMVSPGSESRKSLTSPYQEITMGIREKVSALDDLFTVENRICLCFERREMSINEFKVCVLFGGSGFIGTHFARHLLANGSVEQLFLADVCPPKLEMWPQDLQKEYKSGRVHYVPVDVHKPIAYADLPSQADLVVNLAAVHREPGHEPCEYFATNILGAENVCAWAEQVGCPWIIFTSSIAPYGPTDEEKDESALPVPVTPYGASKLAAEKIHIAWQRGAADRRLLIVRPGVVFGPG